MADLIRNPHEAIQPDFGADEHAHQRQLLREGGLTEEQAIAMLANLWTSTNARDRADWDRIQEQRALARQEDERVAQQEAERQRQEDEVLLEAARAEERKKNKKKFAPVINTPIPIGQVNIPAPVAATRMKKAEYVELWYFTNAGLRAAESSIVKSSKNDGSFVLIHDEETNVASFVPAATAAISASSGLIEDADLSWEDFAEATPRMLSFMGIMEWPQDRIKMFFDFWSAIQSHPWRYVDDELSQRALLVYQGDQRKRWHLAIGTPISWSIAKICDITLDKTRSTLAHKEQARALSAFYKVSPLNFFHLTILCTELTGQSFPPFFIFTATYPSPNRWVLFGGFITHHGFSSLRRLHRPITGFHRHVGFYCLIGVLIALLPPFFSNCWVILVGLFTLSASWIWACFHTFPPLPE